MAPLATTRRYDLDTKTMVESSAKGLSFGTVPPFTNSKILVVDIAISGVFSAGDLGFGVTMVDLPDVQLSNTLYYDVFDTLEAVREPTQSFAGTCGLNGRNNVAPVGFRTPLVSKYLALMIKAPPKAISCACLALKWFFGFDSATTMAVRDESSSSSLSSSSSTEIMSSSSSSSKSSSSRSSMSSRSSSSSSSYSSNSSSSSSYSSISSSSDSSISSLSSGIYPAVYFKFNEAEGDTAWRSETGGYSLGPSNLFGTAQPFSSYVGSGKIGNAIRCKNGSPRLVGPFWNPVGDDLFISGFIPWIYRPTFAISFWIQNIDADMPNDNPRGIVGFKTPGALDYAGRMLSCISTGSGALTGHKDLVFNFKSYQWVTNMDATASNVLTLGGGWNFVVVNFNGIGVPITVYVDNVLIPLTGTTSPTHQFAPPIHGNGMAELYLGKLGTDDLGGWVSWQNSSAYTLSGDIDMFMIHDGPLSEHIIDKLWNGGGGLE
jgi:hypothetical protein